MYLPTTKDIIGFELPTQRDIIMTTATLPAPTTDLDQAKRNLHSHGLCCIPRVLTRAQLQRAHDAVYAAAEDDAVNDRITHDFPLDPNNANQRVWNLLMRDRIFAAMAAHDTALLLVRHVLGWPALLSNISGNIARPGTCPGVLHADQGFVAEPWPERPQGLNVAWCLDDFTAANGATRVVPHSHLQHRPPQADEPVQMVTLEAPAGSVFVFESRLWHQTGENTTSDQSRAGVFAFYTTPAYRTQENWFLTLDEAFLSTASDDLLTLLAYKSNGFGLVYGRSPR